MATEESLAILTNRLKELEAKIGEQQAGPVQAAGSGGQPTIKVTVPRERKLRKYGGARDYKTLEDWVTDAKRAVTGQSDADAVDFLVYHLEGAAKDEVRLRDPAECTTPEGLFKVLRASFSENLTATQALRKFFARRQQDGETVQDFAHALMVMLGRVESLDPSTITGKDKLLREQFQENLRDPTLRRDLKRWARDHPGKTFTEVREELQRWIDDEDVAPTRRAGAREAAASDKVGLACDEQSGDHSQKVISELVSGQKILAEGLRKQQETLSRHIEDQGKILAQQQQILAGLMSRLDKEEKPRGRCYDCGSPEHYRNRCPQRRRGRDSTPGNDSSQAQGPASNSRAPRS